MNYDSALTLYDLGMTEEQKPLRPKATQRQQAILTAARKIFLRDGYHRAKLTAFAEEAGCAVGTLYSYFPDRAALLSQVLDDAEEEMFQAGAHLSPGMSPFERISAVNRAYLAAYRENADVMALMEQVAQADPAFAAKRLDRARGFIARNVRGLTKLIAAEQGHIYGDQRAIADIEMLSAALSSMVSRLAYLTWVEHQYPDTDATFERVAATVDTIWRRTLGLEELTF